MLNQPWYKKVGSQKAQTEGAAHVQTGYGIASASTPALAAKARRFTLDSRLRQEGIREFLVGEYVTALWKPGESRKTVRQERQEAKAVTLT